MDVHVCIERCLPVRSDGMWSGSSVRDDEEQQCEEQDDEEEQR